jgi:hypothetical protein
MHNYKDGLQISLLITHRNLADIALLIYLLKKYVLLLGGKLEDYHGNVLLRPATIL